LSLQTRQTLRQHQSLQPPATTETTVVAAPNPDDEKRAYFAAYEVFKTGGPNKAINPMRNFIKNYPHSTLHQVPIIGLGEFYLAASPADVANAKKSFKIVTEQYADTPKAAAALLKLGSFADVDGKTQEAIKYMLLIVKNFPNTPEANAAKSYLSAQNVPIPVEKVKAKTDTTKATTQTISLKPRLPPKKNPQPTKKRKQKPLKKPRLRHSLLK
jgi:TolA-binding protein